MKQTNSSGEFFQIYIQIVNVTARCLPRLRQKSKCGQGASEEGVRESLGLYDDKVAMPSLAETGVTITTKVLNHF